ncbi:hypothetical protein ARNL5_00404 [Anaerolineae bacterium]|nr:hypothetical protein ARNL5_00404 [Anaerolineae bacterium]
MQVCPASAQQRTPNVTPLRQLRSPQHCELVVQAPCTIEHVHIAPVSRQSAQLPVEGPVVPGTHVPLVSHQPHSERAVQSPHEVAPAQGSGAAHSERSHAQPLAHEPAVGPVSSPSAQAPVAPHQPHVAPPVHASQLVSPTQGSLPPPHSEPSHDQSVHVPVLGPVEVPCRQTPSHQPQLARAVQSAQSAAPAQGSDPPVHSLATHAQSAQLPVRGPLEVPGAQPPVAPHHPQG